MGHAYKSIIGGNKVLVCTYPCMLKADKEHEEELLRRQEAREARKNKKAPLTRRADKKQKIFDKI